LTYALETRVKKNIQ